jgi:hypothetical protein
MVGGKLTFVLVISAVFSFGVLAADKPKLEERTFKNCLFFETEGRVWLREPMVYLGMVGVLGTPPYCLSEDLAKKVSPLVSKILSGREPASTGFYTFEMPRLDVAEDALVLVGLKAQMSLHGDPSEEMMHGPRSGSPRAFYEIVAARMTTAESVSKEWMETWKKLDDALNEIVSTSLTAPGDAKRKAITEVVEKGSKALNAMSRMEVSDDFYKLVNEIEPEARVVRGFQKRVAGQWQGQLAKCIKRLGIEPKIPLPKRLDSRTGLELLVKSESPAKFMSEIKGSYLADALKQYLIYSETLDENVHVRQIERMSQAEFERIRAEAEEKQREYQVLANKQVEQWGVVLRRTAAELSAEKLILRGAVVEKVVTQEAGIGLKANDIIIDYESIYDFVMGDVDFARSMRMLANRAKQGHELRVLRENRLITITVGGD